MVALQVFRCSSVICAVGQSKAMSGRGESAMRSSVMLRYEKAAQPLANTNLELQLPTSAEQLLEKSGKALTPNELVTLEDCKRWIKELADEEIAQSKPVRRLLTPLTILERQPSRQQRTELSELYAPWNVTQKAGQRKLLFPEMKRKLTDRVIEEARRLKRMKSISESADIGPLPNDVQGRFSAIALSLRRGSAAHGA